MRIFVLEDDPERIIWLHERLRGHDVTFVHTCARAHEFAPPYDLVLLDHDLGGRQLEGHEDDGAAFARAIRDQIGSAPVLVHTWNPDGVTRIEAALAGIDALIIAAEYRSKVFDAWLDRFVPR